MSATCGYDFADRPETLTVQVGTDPGKALVTGATYLPSGRLPGLTLGNGMGATDTYLYGTHGAGGHFPILSEIQLGVGGSCTFTYGTADQVEEVDRRVRIKRWGPRR